MTDKYTYGLNRICNIDKNYFYLYDGHGDVLALSNSNCYIIWNYDYDAFGNQNLVGNDGVEPYNPFRYCGEYTDFETNNIYLRARYYEPSVGRFVNEDPIRDGLNWYIYTENNPVNRWDPTGYAWTDEDQATYDALGGFWSKKARTFKKEIDGATKAWNDADGDIYAENNARYRAVVARQGAYANGYVDDFDYTRGQGSLIFLGAHTVVSPANHASVIIMVDSSSSYYDTDNFSANGSLWGGKVQYATLGAGSVDGNLVSDINRKKDKNLRNKNEMINTGTSGDTMIGTLFEYEEYYKKNNTLKYKLFPGKNSVGEHNSNSFARGILNAAGIYPAKPPRNLPGWDQPLKAWHFSP